MTAPVRLHTPSFENPDLPDGYGACLDCGAVITREQLFEEECPTAQEAQADG